MMDYLFPTALIFSLLALWLPTLASSCSPHSQSCQVSDACSSNDDCAAGLYCGNCPASGKQQTTCTRAQAIQPDSLVSGDKPGWKVPVYWIGEGKWVPDSDEITKIIEEDFRLPSLVTPPEYSSLGSAIFPRFINFLKSKDSSESDGAEQSRHYWTNYARLMII